MEDVLTVKLLFNQKQRLRWVINNTGEKETDNM